MSHRLLLACSLAILAASSARAQQMAFSRDVMPSRVALARIGLEPHWHNVVPLSGTEKVLLVSLSEDLVFAQTSESNFHAYDAETGRYLWGTNLGPPSPRAQPASMNSKSVFVTSSDQIYSLDRFTGRTQWVKHLESVPSSATAASEDRVLLAMPGNLSNDIGTGKLWTFFLKNPRAQPLIWSTNGLITARPIPAGPVNAFASHDGRVYVVRLEPPRVIYRFLTGGPISAPMGTYGTRTLLVPSHDHNIYAIDLFTGEKWWSWSTGAPIDQEPLVGDEDVYVLNKEGRMGAVEIKTGRVRWTIETGGGRLLSVGTSRVYVETHDRDLFLVDRQTGTVLADAASVRARGVDLRGFTLTLTNHLNGRLYLASTSGMLICLREIGRTQPMPLRKPGSKPFGWLPQQKKGTPGQPATAPAEAEETKPTPEEAAPAPEPKKEEPEKSDKPEDEDEDAPKTKPK